jgi:hypothetical protein
MIPKLYMEAVEIIAAREGAPIPKGLHRIDAGDFFLVLNRTDGPADVEGAILQRMDLAVFGLSMLLGILTPAGGVLAHGAEDDVLGALAAARVRRGSQEEQRSKT